MRRARDHARGGLSAVRLFHSRTDASGHAMHPHDAASGFGTMLLSAATENRTGRRQLIRFRLPLTAADPLGGRHRIPDTLSITAMRRLAIAGGDPSSCTVLVEV